MPFRDNRCGETHCFKLKQGSLNLSSWLSVSRVPTHNTQQQPSSFPDRELHHLSTYTSQWPKAASRLVAGVVLAAAVLPKPSRAPPTLFLLLLLPTRAATTAAARPAPPTTLPPRPNVPPRRLRLLPTRRAPSSLHSTREKRKLGVRALAVRGL